MGMILGCTIIGLFIILGIRLKLNRNKRIKEIWENTQLTKNDYKKITKMYKDNKAISIFFLLFILLLFIWFVWSIQAEKSRENIFLNMGVYLAPIFIVMSFGAILLFRRETVGFNIDSILYEKYNLEKIENTMEKSDAEVEIQRLREDFKINKKSNKWMNFKLDYEKSKLENKIEKLKKMIKTNEYQKIDDDGSKIIFRYHIEESFEGKYVYYNINCSLINDDGVLKSIDKIEEVEDNYKFLQIDTEKYRVDREISSEFYNRFNKINAKTLLSCVCYSFEACTNIFE